MKLNVVKPKALDFTEQVGISNERARELGNKLDAIADKYRGRPIYTWRLYEDIAAICETPEELIFAVASNTCYLAAIFNCWVCPPKRNNKHGGKWN